MTFTTLIDYIGTFAFAISGIRMAAAKKFDWFGAYVVGLVTAVGGGTIRDVLLGVIPPSTFRDPIYALTAVVVSLVVFLRPVRRYLAGTHTAYQRTMLAMDSLGLGVFTAVGVSLTYAAQPDARLFLAVFAGVLSGVGGGVLRDVMAGDTPYIFVKHVYACASLAGALTCALLWKVVGQTFAMLAGAALVVLIRILSATYKWNLPRAD